MKKKTPASGLTYRAALLAACSAAVLSACGGGGSDATTARQAAAEISTGTLTLDMEAASLPDEASALLAQPLFHAAPALLGAPDDADALSPDASAHRPPHRERLSADSAGLPTRRLTVQDIQAHQRSRAASAAAGSGDGMAAPMAGGSVIATYTPAQIRAAYALPALPGPTVAPTASQAAQMGAGQTIYIIAARHDPNVVAELAAFNQKFGLPACTTRAIPVTTSLPLSAASKLGCEFSVVYNTAAGGMSSTVPAYDSGWATEIALDVQWAHATAPLARIVLIEAADPSVTSLVGAVKLANAMGPGIVSMSFGAQEGSWTASVDSTFGGASMSYLAATGDSGMSVAWPSVSPSVLAIGGTTLTYSGTGTRSEVSWSGTGGGISQYTPTPAYQTSAVPGMGTAARRTLADVALNADPASGQYVAIVSPGSTSVSWISAGGTSLSTPQWAGLLAVTNATRSLAAKPALGAPHGLLYGQVASVPGSYASAFADITVGSNGTCSICSARVGYDPLSGLGTPNVGNMLNILASAGNATAPAVTSASISGTSGKTLSFTVSVIASNPVSYSLKGAPAGMSVGSNGVVSWATPVAGTYAVTVTATDTKTGLSGQGLYTLTGTTPPAPVVASGAISGTAGTPLSFAASVSASNPVTYSLVGAPAGMSISSLGTVSWPVPVAGSYRVSVLAKDTKTGLSGQGVYSVAISVPLPPVVGSATVNGKPGVALSFPVSVSAPNAVTYTLSGAPAGMTVSATGVVSWAQPVLGTYAVTVVARDTKTGLTGRGIYTVAVAAAGPQITAPAMTGKAGTPLTGTIGITAPGATSISISISGVPLGMGFSVSGLTITAGWPSPVQGSYTLQVVVRDNAGRSATASIPVNIAR